MPKTSSPEARGASPSDVLDATLAPFVDPKKLPAFLQGASLPPLLLADGAALSADQTTRLLRAIVTSGITDRKIAPAVRAALDRASSDAFAAALLDLWGTLKYHGRASCLLGAVGELGGDRAALALEPLVDAWSESGAGDTARKRAIAALPVLRRISTDTAILVLMGLRQRAVLPSVLEAIIEEIARVTRDLRTTESELSDRITPTLGLDARGTRTFSYGSRSFSLALDAHFDPALRDETGAVIGRLPPADPRDDPALVDQAKLGFSMLQRELREAVKVQSFRLEQDMIRGRRWDAATWTRCLQRHPLMVSFTRRLLWGVYGADGGLVAGFRTAEDDTLVGIDDAVFTLSGGARIGVVHPLHLDEAARVAWSQHFADYEIIPPFPQLGRAVDRPGDDERERKSTARFARDRFKSGVIRDTLVRRGWERDPSGYRKFYRRTFEGDRIVATAHLEPGVQAGAATYEVKDQAIVEIDFRRMGDKRMGPTITLDAVPPVAFSEALLDVREVLAEQDG